MNAWSQQRLEWYKVCAIADNSDTIDGPDRAAKHFRDLIEVTNGYEFEHLMAVFMTVQSKIVGSCVFGIGGFDQAFAARTVLFKKFFTTPGATCMIIGHNHPSGTLAPSSQDIHFATQLNNAAKLLGAPILDHLIITHKSYTKYHVPSDLGQNVLSFDP